MSAFGGKADIRTAFCRDAERRLVARLDAGRVDCWPPFGSLGLMIRRERFWILLTAREYHHAKSVEPLPHARVSQRRQHCVNKTIDNRLGRPCGGPQAMPKGQAQSRRARFDHCRRVRRS